MLSQFGSDARSTEMENVLRARGAHHAITELYSPPRIVPLAERCGLKAGYSLDLAVRGPDGHFGDFTRLGDRVKVWKLIARDRPCIIIGSPPCTLFSQLQNLSRGKPGGEERYPHPRTHAELHLAFCTRVYRHQLRQGIFFTRTPCRSQFVEFDVCRGLDEVTYGGGGQSPYVCCLAWRLRGTMVSLDQQ